MPISESNDKGLFLNGTCWSFIRFDSLNPNEMNRLWVDYVGCLAQIYIRSNRILLERYSLSDFQLTNATCIYEQVLLRGCIT